MNAARVLRSARRRAGMSQRALATAARVPQATIGRIEAGTVTPRVDTLTALLAAVGADLEVVPRIGEGVDRSLIRDRLKLSPAQRIRLAVEEGRRMPRIRVRRE